MSFSQYQQSPSSYPSPSSQPLSSPSHNAPMQDSTSPSSFPSISSIPMSIPKSKDFIPPPLPPPRHIQDTEIAWKWGNGNDDGFGRRSSNGHGPSASVSQRSRDIEPSTGSQRNGILSRDGSMNSSGTIHGDGRGLEGIEDQDEGYDSLSGSMQLGNKLRGEEPLSTAFQNSVDKAYDKSLLSRLDATTTKSMIKANKSPRNYFPSSLRNPSKASTQHERHEMQLTPLSMPDTPASAISTPAPAANAFARWNGAVDFPVSPRLPSQPNSPRFTEYRSAPEHKGSLPSLRESEKGYGREGTTRGSLSGSVRSGYDDASSLPSRSHRGSYDRTGSAETISEFQTEETRLKKLNLGDQTPPGGEAQSSYLKAGQKRRASSPPREHDTRTSVGAVNGNELHQRRASGRLPSCQRSPVQRLNHDSISSMSSATRNGSYASSAGVSHTASSLTSASSLDRVSPGTLSPYSEAENGLESPYIGSLNPSPRSSLSRPHQRCGSESKPLITSQSLPTDGQVKRHSVPRLQGVHICECCPKKPKKFNSSDELRAHEREKQYMCQYCQNRFKNKNEAERHQNSLHLRRHSWSCAQLSGVEAAFHPSAHRPAQADVCGYCGEEFSNPADLGSRVDHLTIVHKFGECNLSKKFFRADHFRQHLKHSHAGTSGKWTNMLENACMKDEPVPERLGSVSGDVIDEVHEES